MYNKYTKIVVFEDGDYRPLYDGENYVNKFVVLDPSQFKEEYRDSKYCLMFACGGFGCYPDKIGGKVFGYIIDEEYCTRREYILGVASDILIDEFLDDYREEFMDGPLSAVVQTGNDSYVLSSEKIKNWMISKSCSCFE